MNQAYHHSEINSKQNPSSEILEHCGVRYRYTREPDVKEDVIISIVGHYAYLMDQCDLSDSYDSHLNGMAAGLDIAIRYMGVEILNIRFKDNWSGDIHYFSSLDDAVSAAEGEAGSVNIYSGREVIATIEGLGVCQ